MPFYKVVMKYYPSEGIDDKAPKPFNKEYIVEALSSMEAEMIAEREFGSSIDEYEVLKKDKTKIAEVYVAPPKEEKKS